MDEDARAEYMLKQLQEKQKEDKEKGKKPKKMSSLQVKLGKTVGAKS